MANPITGIREIIVRLRKKPKPTWKRSISRANVSHHVLISRVTIDPWGGTSVNPSEVFRTPRGRADLEAQAELATKLELNRRENARRTSHKE